MSLCVTVTGPPSAICFSNKGITEPFEPSTLPKRTATNFVDLLYFPIVWIIISQIRFVAPIILVGLTALSVEICTKTFAPNLSAQRATFNVPKTLFFTASFGLVSINGTCLCAAALKIISGPYLVKTSSILPTSLMLAISVTRLSSGWRRFNSCSISYALFS